MGEITIDGVKQKWLKLRNPWGVHEWKPKKFSKKPGKYNKYEAKVKSMAWNKGDKPGTFLMTYEDFLKQFESFEIAFGQHNRDGLAMNPEYRPFVKIPKKAAGTSGKTSYVRITLFEDIDLATDWLNIDIIQGGNRIG